MNVEIRHRPTFAALFVTLAPGDTIIAEADAMISMSSNIAMRTRFNGGFFKAILRKIFGGESLFVNEFSCNPSSDRSGELVLSQGTPGDLQCLELNGNVMFLQPGAYVACGPDVRLGLGWAGFRSWFAKEGLFRLKVSGRGPVWFGGYGAVVEREVTGEYVVDTSHMLAYEPTVSLNVALSGGLFSSIFGGEGFVSRVKGQGKIYMQSRSMEGLAAWTNTNI